MHSLPSRKVVGALFSIINEAQTELVLVSPNVYLTYWKALATAIAAARDRGVKVACYVRHTPNYVTTTKQVEALGITPHQVANLQTAFYYNETGGLVTSMNLVSTINGQNNETGYLHDSAREVDELRRSVEQFAVLQETVEPLDEVTQLADPATFIQELTAFLTAKVNRRAQIIRQEGGGVVIQVLGNTFLVAIEGSAGQLVVRSIITGDEADRFAAKQRGYFASVAFACEVQRGGEGEPSQLRGTWQQPISVATFSALTGQEQAQLFPQLASFLTAVWLFKRG